MKIRVCGVEFDDLSAEEAVKRALQDTGEPCWVVTPNAKMLASCQRNPEERGLLNSAGMVLPDGMGVVRAAKRQGSPFRGRTAGIDFGEKLMEAAARRGERVFLLGGRDGVAALAAERLGAQYPGLCICGCYWGYFEKQGQENRELIGWIRACRPTILLVCMGYPTQERWIRENLPGLPSVKVAAGLGGSLDVWSGQVTRAPRYWQEHGMEWAWRMLNQPERIRDLPELWRFAFRK